MLSRLTIFLLLTIFVSSAFPAELRNLRMHEAPTSVRFVFDTSEKINYKIFYLENPNRIVVDLKNVQLKTDLNVKSLLASSKQFKGMRVAKRGRGYRFVVDTKKKIPYKAFSLEPVAPYGHRLVVDMQTLESKAQVKQGREQQLGYRDIVVVIDPGHGGEDPGAIGPKNIQEKRVVLQIARRVKKKLDAKKGFSATVLRNGDYYVPLVKRTEFARKSRADCFVSLHADAFKSSKVFGASVYMLSEKGASSESAKWLEDLEKKSDLIGGAGELSILGTKGDVNLNNEVPFLAETLLDLSMNANRSKSDRLGRSVLTELKRVTPLHKKTLEKAGFVVLKRPDVPSILIEAGFISNPREARRLTQLEHQEKLSKAIATGIEKYFEQDPPMGSFLSSRNETTKYRVVKGDTLSEISLRFGVTAKSVKQLNNLKSNRIKVGQLLVIPAKKR